MLLWSVALTDTLSTLIRWGTICYRGFHLILHLDKISLMGTTLPRELWARPSAQCWLNPVFFTERKAWFLGYDVTYILESPAKSGVANLAWQLHLLCGSLPLQSTASLPRSLLRQLLVITCPAVCLKEHLRQSFCWKYPSCPPPFRDMFRVSNPLSWVNMP